MGMFIPFFFLAGYTAGRDRLGDLLGRNCWSEDL